MKQPFFVTALMIACLVMMCLAGFSQKADRLLTRSFFTSGMLSDSSMIISAASYFCFTTHWASITFKKDRYGYEINWKRTYSRMEKKDPDSGLIYLDQTLMDQLAALETNAKPVLKHSRDCRGVIALAIVCASETKVVEMCSCGFNAHDALVKIIESANKVPPPLTKIQTVTYKPN